MRIEQSRELRGEVTARPAGRPGPSDAVLGGRPGATRAGPGRRVWPGRGLTAPRGLRCSGPAGQRPFDQKQIARQLVVSPKTGGRNHVEHIYAKLGVSRPRLGRTLFATHRHGLVGSFEPAG